MMVIGIIISAIHVDIFGGVNQRRKKHSRNSSIVG